MRARMSAILGARAPMARTKIDTSWGSVADWYSSYLEEGEDTYQSAVLLPNLVRLLGTRPLRIIDVACGQGYFTRAFQHAGHTVVGADIAPELIREARALSPALEFHIAPSDELRFAKAQSFDAATIILAIQNIERMSATFSEVARTLVPRGRLYLVLMHPVFRVPKASEWGYDAEADIQYRRIDRYLSQSRSEFLVHPGATDSPVTVSYHRSLQDYAKALSKAGFAITKLEEWISHKESQKGPRQKAENTARKEIPLFLCIEATVVS